ncbi:MAG: GHMP family kinase ATP-binding protein, partial [Candidatus Thorarchaeota archaeon]
MTIRKPFCVRAPGRICLFGEHSDYFGLDVITAATEFEIKIVSYPRDDDTISVRYTDINEEDEFPVDTLLAHRHDRDYLRSAFNVILEENIKLENGWDVEVSGNIPMAGGLSSSSALSVASIMLAAHMGGKKLRPVEVVRLAFETEVERFGESGGMMDHYASTFGDIIHVAMTSDLRVTKLPAVLKSFVIGDSRLKKKDTVGDLREIRKIVETGYKQIRKSLPDF